jgi:hypothetical protein
MEKKTNAPITPVRPLPGDSAPLGVIDTAAEQLEAEIKATVEEGGDRSEGDIPLEKKYPKNPRKRDLPVLLKI